MKRSILENAWLSRMKRSPFSGASFLRNSTLHASQRPYPSTNSILLVFSNNWKEGSYPPQQQKVYFSTTHRNLLASSSTSSPLEVDVKSDPVLPSVEMKRGASRIIPPSQEVQKQKGASSSYSSTPSSSILTKIQLYLSTHQYHKVLRYVEKKFLAFFSNKSDEKNLLVMKNFDGRNSRKEGGEAEGDLLFLPFQNNREVRMVSRKFLMELCQYREQDAVDVLCLLMKTYQEVEVEETSNNSGSGKYFLNARGIFYLGLSALQGFQTKTRQLGDDEEEIAVQNEKGGKQKTEYCAPNLLNHQFFHTYLETLMDYPPSLFPHSEVMDVLNFMKTNFGARFYKNEKTYALLMEIHLHLGLDPIALWNEVLEKEDSGELPPSSSIQSCALLEQMTHKIVLGNSGGGRTSGGSGSSSTSSNSTRFKIEILSRLIQCVNVDKQLLVNVFHHFVESIDTAPEHAVWVLLELEQLCVLDRTRLREHLGRPALVQILLKCAKCGDTISAEQILGLMERHMISKTKDVFALFIWAYAQAEHVESALDTVEEMARKGFLNNTDAFRYFTLEALSLPLEKNPLQLLAESLHTTALVDRAYYHLERRKKSLGKSVSVHSLDVVVLACSKLGDEERAIETLESYASLDVVPRTQSYNALLIACIGRNKSVQHRTVFEAMKRNGVVPNSHTYRLLIRQAVMSDNIEEALEWLKVVTDTSSGEGGGGGIRLEVEMLLPVLERAARAADIDTVMQVLLFSIEYDIGIDGNLLRNYQSKLEEHGVDTRNFVKLIPVHEKLKSRTPERRRSH